MSSCQPTLSIRFLGGAGAIGASAALVRVDGTSVLVDCGVRFQSSRPLPDLAQIDVETLDAILVTHAHSDHTGGLPIVAEAFPGVRVYATPPTIDLVRILTKDALRIMGRYREHELPLYTDRQAGLLLEQLTPVQHHASVTVGCIKATYLPAAHILGASMVHLETPAGSVLFTGDYSVSPQRTVPALPRPAVRADVVITETTYGDRLHEDRTAAEQRLIAQVRETLEAGGRVLIPAFAIGRAQEILLILKEALRREQLPAVPVYVDGMVRSVCDVYRRHPRYVTRALANAMRKDKHPFYTAGIQPLFRDADRQKALAGGPCVFVASSGMLAGGASQFYASHLVENERDAILITGYQDEESPGRGLLNLADAQGPRELKLGDQRVQVRCKVAKYGLSAHADRMQMVGLLEGIQPRTVVLVHGNRPAKEQLARALSCRDLVLADDGFELVRGYSVRKTDEHARLDVRRRLAELDLERAQALLGPPRDEPLQLRQVANSLFGRKVDLEGQDALMARLEVLGVARRDDARHGVLWVAGELEDDELALEEQLKAQNPKGRLLEFCQRARVPKPRFDPPRPSGKFFVGALQLVFDGRVYDTGPVHARSKLMVEQLAYRQVFNLLRAEEEDLQVRVVDEATAVELKSENPKGRLLERCRGAVFETVPDTRGYRARVVVGDRCSDWFVACAPKDAEHAAASALLDQLGGVECAPEAAASPAPTTNARTRLNELRQAGVLKAFGYEVVDQRGPPHQRVFVMAAWAQDRDGRRVVSESVEAGSKKVAEAIAAERLMASLA